MKEGKEEGKGRSEGRVWGKGNKGNENGKGRRGNGHQLMCCLQGEERWYEDRRGLQCWL